MRWKEPTTIEDEFEVELKDYNPLLRQLLYNRGIRSVSDAKLFLRPSIDQLEDPLSMFDVESAASAIEEVIKQGKRIFVHGDFDADGICATSILWGYLYRQRKAKVLPYIPSRVDEGYGLSEKSIEAIIKKGGEMVITVDCGIRDVEIIKKYRRSSRNPKGLEFIVTDHHELGKKIPRYVPIVHPRHPKGNYKFGNLSGAGVAWKLVAAMEKLRFPNSFNWKNIPGLDLVALATVCDIMPLVGENRILVKFGLERIREKPSIGLQALINVSQISLQEVDTYHLGFILGPRINAAGRLGDAMDAVRLLTTQKASSARFLAEKLTQLNKERQDMTDVVMNEVREQIELQGSGKHIYFAHSQDWPEGIIGTAAGKLMDELNHPVILLSQNGKTAKGSARSISDFNIIEAIEKQSDILANYGGHKQAAGFTVDSDKIDELSERLEKIAQDVLSEENFIKEISADVQLDAGELTWKVNEMIDKLAPFGYGNRKPVFWIKDATVYNVSTVGDGNKHLKLFVKGQEGEFLSCIYFGGGDMAKRLAEGDTIDLIGHLEINVWNGEENLQFRVLDIKI